MSSTPVSETFRPPSGRQPVEHQASDPAPTQRHWIIRPENDPRSQHTAVAQPASDRRPNTAPDPSRTASPSGSLLGGPIDPQSVAPTLHDYEELPAPSLGDYLNQAMQPAGAKLLIGVATVLLFLAVGQLLGLVPFPFGGGGQAVGTSGLSAADAPTDAVTATTEGLAEAGGGLSTFATLAVPSLDDGRSGSDPASPTTAQPSLQTTTSTTIATTTPTIQTTPTPLPTTPTTGESSSTTADPTSSTTGDSSSTTVDPTSTSGPSTTATSTSTTDSTTSSTTEGSTTTSESTTSTTEKQDGGDEGAATG